MKKLFISLGVALALGAGVLGFNKSKALKADATPGSELMFLLRSYNDGGYTKKTQMYLTDAAVSDLAEYFHAGQNTLKRATYYSEDEQSLLMGNYDGTFGGVGGINGGFRNISAVACERFHYTDETPNVEHLFAAEHTETDYVALNQTVGSYYQTLQSLSEEIDDSWVKDGDAYIYNLSDITVTDGEYNNSVLKKFQYFAAPMMLQNAYFSWHSIRVIEGASFLSIRLYSTQASGEGKSTIIGANEALISEARVYKGINLHPEVAWTLKGSFDDWGAGEAFEYQADLYNPEQYSLTKAFVAGNAVKIDGPEWHGFDNLENQDWFYSNSDNNIEFKASGTYTIYWKPKTNSIYINVPDFEYTISWTDDWINNDNPKLFAWAIDGSEQGSWILTNYSGGQSVNITLSSNIRKLVLVRSANTNETGGWNKSGGYWNKTNDIAFNLGTFSYSNVGWIELK